MHSDFRTFIVDEEIKINLEQTIQKNCFLPRIKSPKDIIPILQKLCQHISNNFRIRVSSIRAEKKVSTYLSSLFLRTIYNVFCKGNLSLTTCRNMIKSINFDLDEEIKDSKKEYKSWFKDFFGYKTQAEEEISYLADKYINLYCEQLDQNDKECLIILNKLRKSFNEGINGLIEISNEFKK